MSFAYAASTIFLALAGSRAQGTAGEHADVDVRGVCVVPLARRLALFTPAFEQYEGPLDAGLLALVQRPLPDVSAECVVFDVAKLVRLCAAANPSALELLFTDPEDVLFATPAWSPLHDARAMFLTRRIEQTFHGYAAAQLRRIEAHRARLLDGTFEPPAGRNPARAALERAHGYDTKHAMHLVRLMRMGIEALEEGELRVRRGDAEELRAIREGALDHEAFVALATSLFERMASAAATTSLPAEVDYAVADALARELMLAVR